MLKLGLSLLLAISLVAGFYGYRNSVVSNEVWWENERYRADLLNQTEIAKIRLQQRTPSTESMRGETLIDQVTNNNGLLQKLREKEAFLKTDLKKIESTFFAYRETKINEQRAKVIGQKWSKFTGAGEKTFWDVTVVSVEDAGVMLRHRDGVSRLRYDDLTAEQCHNFGLEKDRAARAMDKEHVHAHAYERWVALETGKQRLSEQVSRDDDQVREIQVNAQYSAPQRKAFNESDTGYSNVAPNATSPLTIKSLSDPAKKVGENARFRVRGGPRYYYIYNGSSTSCQSSCTPWAERAYIIGR